MECLFLLIKEKMKEHTKQEFDLITMLCETSSLLHNLCHMEEGLRDSKFHKVKARKLEKKIDKYLMDFEGKHVSDICPEKTEITNNSNMNGLYLVE
jgi:CYTH domain-containing protein